MNPTRLIDKLRDIGHWCFQKSIVPLLDRIARRLQRWSAPHRASSEAPEEWKQHALADFSAWLADLPDLESHGEPGLQTCDLYTLLTEFAALRQEIKLQNREQHAALRSQDTLAGRLQDTVVQLDDRLARLGRIDETRRREIELATVRPFLDLRDALVRGQAAARAAARPRGFRRRPPKGSDAVAEGYAMALRRFDRALEPLGIQPIDTLERPFDAACMRAVEKRHVPDRDPGIVLEEIAGGFTRAGDIVRTAEVVVNRK